MTTLSRDKLIAAAASSKEVNTLNCGALAVYTGKCTGRSPNAKSILRDSSTESVVDWKNNKQCSSHEWAETFIKARDFEFQNKDSITVQQLYAGRDENLQIGLKVKTSKTWQAVFANNMFVRERSAQTDPSEEWELLCFPEMEEDPRVMINFTFRKIVITGTHYAGEIKKSIFTVLNLVLPEKNVLPMHCSVNTDLDGQNSAIFFGLSGTGKTTLSASDDRILIGDDEHGWSSTGLFNFEGGCYAKVINLGRDSEPEIWSAVQQKGAVLENVVITEDGSPDFFASDFTENTRGSYPIDHIPNASETGLCGHPENIIFLTCDAFGVLPPVSRLSNDEAISHFLMGYTAKVAGTEAGVTEPQATFSHCFGAPFMPRPATDYAEILSDKIQKYDVNCWLVNTGWSGGEYGTGSRMPITVSRAVVRMILSGELSSCEFKKHEHTGLTIPASTPDSQLNSYLVPEDSWQDKNLYAEKAESLMSMWSAQLKKISHTS